jgi:hypothetical protein
MGMVTFYAYYLMSKVLDYCERDGRRHIRFRELAADVLGNYKPPFLFLFFFLFFYMFSVELIEFMVIESSTISNQAGAKL